MKFLPKLSDLLLCFIGLILLVQVLAIWPMCDEDYEAIDQGVMCDICANPCIGKIVEYEKLLPGGHDYHVGSACVNCAPKSLGKCPFCFGLFLRSNLVFYCGALHYGCKPCVQGYIAHENGVRLKEAVLDKIFTPILCPVCKLPLQQEALSSYDMHLFDIVKQQRLIAYEKCKKDIWNVASCVFHPGAIIFYLCMYFIIQNSIKMANGTI